VIIWVDAQLSPALAPWIIEQFGIDAASMRYLGLVNALDPEIFNAARSADAVVLTKDADFVVLLEQFGPPPHILWVRWQHVERLHA
jgi:predicted nuclease of predicted toxin-antitoxin system